MASDARAYPTRKRDGEREDKSQVEEQKPNTVEWININALDSVAIREIISPTIEQAHLHV